jgi:hypothetical protein
MYRILSNEEPGRTQQEARSRSAFSVPYAPATPKCGRADSAVNVGKITVGRL